MKYKCRSCQREFSKLLIPLESIKILPSQLRPGDMVPDGQCLSCRGFVYAEGRFATAKKSSANDTPVYEREDLAWTEIKAMFSYKEEELLF
jgi:hypothetical protein